MSKRDKNKKSIKWLKITGFVLMAGYFCLIGIEKGIMIKTSPDIWQRFGNVPWLNENALPSSLYEAPSKAANIYNNGSLNPPEIDLWMSENPGRIHDDAKSFKLVPLNTTNPLNPLYPKEKPNTEADIQLGTEVASFDQSSEPVVQATYPPAVFPPISDSEGKLFDANAVSRNVGLVARTTMPPDEILQPLPIVSELIEKYSNDDLIAYLRIEGTSISYPVAQGSNNEYYLDHDLYGNYSVAGCLFADYESDAELGYNTIIYGHNMKNGSMFHNLRYYFDKQYFYAHPYIRLMTANGETKWEIFAFYQTGTEFNYIQADFDNAETFFGLALQMQFKSLYETGVKVKPGDKILTLSTCASEGGDIRYVLNARLINEVTDNAE